MGADGRQVARRRRRRAADKGRSKVGRSATVYNERTPWLSRPDRNLGLSGPFLQFIWVGGAIHICPYGSCTSAARATLRSGPAARWSVLLRATPNGAADRLQDVPISEVPQRTRMLQSDKVRRGCSGHLLQLHSVCSEVSAGRHFSRWMGSGCQGRPAPHSTASTGHMEGAEPTLPGCIGERCTENKAFLSHGCVTLKLFCFWLRRCCIAASLPSCTVLGFRLALGACSICGTNVRC